MHLAFKSKVCFVYYLSCKIAISFNFNITNIQWLHLKKLARRLFSHTATPSLQVKTFKNMQEKGKARGMTVSNQVSSTVLS